MNGRDGSIGFKTKYLTVTAHYQISLQNTKRNLFRIFVNIANQ